MAQASVSRASGNGYANQVLDLNGELASGLYMVKISPSEKTCKERLVILR